MRPVVLSLRAFGPFCENLRLDFSSLPENELFLITGPTGSGKTTIFDAICFALYGEASGELRQSENFKCLLAPPDTICEVSLSFTLKGALYHIQRTPKQSKLKRDGSLGERPATASLTLPDGTVLTGSEAVTKKVTQLMGIDQAQFKKIVMLPQGEFRKLLDAKSDEKREILQRIFSTQLFAAVTEEFGARAKRFESEIRELQMRNQAYLSGIDGSGNTLLLDAAGRENPDMPEVLRLLEEDGRNTSEKLQKIQAEQTALEQQKEQINIPYAIEINRKFENLETYQNTLETLKNEEPVYAEKKVYYQRLTAAARLFDVYDSLQQQIRLKEGLRQQIQDCQNTRTEVSNALQLAEKRCADAQAAWPEAEEAEKQLGILDTLRQIFTEIKQAENTRSDLQKELQKQDRMAENQRLAKLRFSSLQEVESARQTAGLLRSLQQSVQALVAAVQKTEDARGRYRQTFLTFLDGQAGMLASRLVPGAPCPVCGSVNHPQPAKPVKAVSKDEVDACAAAYETAQKQQVQLEKACHTALEQLQQADAALVSASSVPALLDNTAALVQAVDMAEQTVAQKQKILDSRTEEVVRVMGEAVLSNHKLWNADYLSSREVELTAAHARLSGALDSLDAQIASLRQRLPQDLQEEETLLSQYRHLSSRQTEIRETIESAKKTAADIQTQYAVLNERVCVLQTQLAQAEQECGRQTEILRNMEQSSGFSGPEDYLPLRSQLPETVSLEKQLQSYTNSLTLYTETVRTLRQELNGLTPFDLPAMQDRLKSLDQELQTQRQMLLSLSTRADKNKHAAQHIQDNLSRSQNLLTAHQQVDYLFRLASGNNPQRLSFERYILASYFNDVIACANQRLKIMTDARYRLQRRQERQKYGAASGLDLEIFDFTAGKCRPVSTLSGGESFIASLALALGLADVASQYAGGVEINTMFIDEGFGSLDEESLESAVACLQNLRQNGRLIGVISHMPELKEKISTRLVVSKGKNGSTARFIL